MNKRKSKKGTSLKDIKSDLQTMFWLDYQQLYPDRVTLELIHSPEMVAMRDAFVDLFMPVVLKTKQGKESGSGDQ